MAEMDGKIRIGFDIEPLDRAQFDKDCNALIRKLNKVGTKVDEFVSKFNINISTSGIDNITKSVSNLDSALTDAVNNKSTVKLEKVTKELDNVSKVSEKLNTSLSIGGGSKILDFSDSLHALTLKETEDLLSVMDDKVFILRDDFIKLFNNINSKDAVNDIVALGSALHNIESTIIDLSKSWGTLAQGINIGAYENSLVNYENVLSSIAERLSSNFDLSKTFSKILNIDYINAETNKYAYNFFSALSDSFSEFSFVFTPNLSFIDTFFKSYFEKLHNNFLALPGDVVYTAGDVLRNIILTSLDNVRASVENNILNKPLIPLESQLEHIYNMFGRMIDLQSLISKIDLNIDLSNLNKAAIPSILGSLNRRMNELIYTYDELSGRFSMNISNEGFKSIAIALAAIISKFYLLNDAMNMISSSADFRLGKSFDDLSSNVNNFSYSLEDLKSRFNNIRSGFLFKNDLLGSLITDNDVDLFRRRIEIAINSALYNMNFSRPQIELDPVYEFSTDEMLRKLDEDIKNGSIKPKVVIGVDVNDDSNTSLMAVNQHINNSVNSSNKLHNILKAVGAVTSVIALGARNISTFISSCVDKIKKIINVIKSIVKFIGKIVSSVAKFNSKLHNAFGVAEKLKNVLSNIGLGKLADFNLLSSLLSKLQSLTKDLFKESIKSATNFNEACLRINNTFGDMADLIFDATNINESGYINAASKIGVALRSSIKDTKELASVTNGLTYAANDVAAAWGSSITDVSNQFMTAIEGSGRALKSYGIVMTDTYVAAYAKAHGLNAEFSSLNEESKRLYRTQYLLDQLQRSGYMGMSAKLANTWSGQVRTLNANLENLRISLGQILQKLLLPILKVINSILSRIVDMTNALAKAFGINKYKMYLETPAGDSSYSSYYDDAAKAVGDVADAQNDLANKTKKAADAAKKSLAPFHKLNILQDKDTSSGDSTGDVGDLNSGLSSLLNTGEKLKNEAKSWVDEWMSAIKKAWDLGSFEQVGALIADAFTKILESIDGFILKAEKKLRKGSKILARVVNGFIGEMFKRVGDNWYNGWQLLGKTIGDGINLLVHTVLDFVDNIDLIALGAGIGEAIRGALDSIDFYSLGRFLSIKAKVLFDTLRGLVLDLDLVDEDGVSGWQLLGVAIADFFNGFFDLPWEDLGDTLARAANGIGDALKALSDNFSLSDLAHRFAEGFNNLLVELDPEKVIKGLAAVVNNLVSGLWTLISEINWVGFGQRVGELLGNALLELDWGTFIDGCLRLITGLLAGLLTALVSFGATLGKRLGEAIYDGFSNSAEEFSYIGSKIWDAIKKGFVDIFKSSFEIGEKIGEAIYDAVSSVFKIISDIFSGDKQKISDAFSKIGEFIVKGLVNGISEHLGINLEFISKLFSNLIELVKNIFGIHSPSKVFSDIGKYIVEGLFNGISENWASFVESVNTFFTNLFSGLSSIVKSGTSVLVSKFTELKEKALRKISSLVSSATSKFGTLSTNLATKASEIKEKVAGKFSELKSNLSSLASGIKSSILGTFNTLRSGVVAAFQGMKSGIVGVFKSIVTAVKAPINALLGLIERMLNGAIDGINSAANMANKLSFDMPEALGGKHVGIDLPTLEHISLPKLAKGAVIQPNHEFAAILGDQRRGVNIETPLETMISAFESSLANMGVAGGGDITIPVYIGQQLLDEIVVNANRKANYRSNGR